MPFVVLSGGGAPAQQPQFAPAAYLHIQDVPSTIWDVHHQMGYDPAAFLVTEVDGDRWHPRIVEYLDPGQTVRLTFAQAIAGTARTS